MTMMIGEVGRFDSRMHSQVYDIAPYGRVGLGRGVSTFTLLSCSAVAVQLVSDQNAVRFNEGSTLPSNGVQRWLRNPYSHAVRVEILEDLPVQMVARQQETDIGFMGVHSSRLSWRDNAETVGKRKGMILMAVRGDLYFSLKGWGSMNTSLVPDAKAEYQDLLPAGVFEHTIDVITSNGVVNDNYTARAGLFTDPEMGQWIADTGWNRSPVLIAENIDRVSGVLKHGTALVAAGTDGAGFEGNITLTDLGDWRQGS